MIAQVLMACSLGLMVWWMASLLGRRNTSQGRVLQDYYAARGTQDARAQLGERVARRLPISLEVWEGHLRWAQRGRGYPNASLGGVVFQALVFGGAGALVLLLNPVPAAFLVPLAAFAYPFVRLRSKANTVRKRVFRTLPETAALIAAELAAGTVPDVAVARAAEIPGPLSVLLQEAIQSSQRSGRPLFSRKPVSGTLLETMRGAGLPALSAFGSQLDLVSSKGVAGAALMSEIARALGQDYRARLQSSVEKLDSRLVMAVALFFFAPFVGLILFGALNPILSIFVG